MGIVDISKFEYFAPYPADTPRTSLTATGDISNDVIDSPEYIEIDERTLPDSTGAGRTIQIKLGQYEDVMILKYQGISTVELIVLKAFRDASRTTDFIYSPDGTIRYRVNFFGNNPMEITQPDYAEFEVTMKIIIKETLAPNP